VSIIFRKQLIEHYNKDFHFRKKYLKNYLLISQDSENQRTDQLAKIIERVNECSEPSPTTSQFPLKNNVEIFTIYQIFLKSIF